MTTTRSPASGSSILAWKGCRFVCTTGRCLSEEGQEIPVSGERPCSEESARTATEGGSSGVREEPDRTQWSEDGLGAADRKADQLVQQHWGFLSRDHDSMAAL